MTLSGPALIAPLTAVTLIDGSYRFRALGRGAYDLVFEIPGFRTLVREGVIVEGSRAIRIDAGLELAAVAESVTVSGAAPVVDVKTTALVNDFGVEELQEVPSATDVWAVLGQTAGVRMRGFDVGGSHKSQQTEYESFGIRGQHRVLADGVDTTEGTGGTGFYFDYYSIEEFTTTAAGADVEMTSPGSLLLMTMKSGGNDFSGMYHTDYEPGTFVGDNVDDALASRGYTGNPNLLFFENHELERGDQLLAAGGRRRAGHRGPRPHRPEGGGPLAVLSAPPRPRARPGVRAAETVQPAGRVAGAAAGAERNRLRARGRRPGTAATSRGTGRRDRLRAPTVAIGILRTRA